MMNKKELYLCISVMAGLALYFFLATPMMQDDGFHYQGFAEALAHGTLDFKSYYGFQGLSFFAVPIVWLTGSPISIIYASMIFSLLSMPLAYLIGRDWFSSRRAGWLAMALILLMPYPHVTLLRGFQEAALLFFILLIIYGSIHRKNWTPIAWAIGGIVKPFALVLLPLFFDHFWNRRRVAWLIAGLLIGGAYLGANFYQTGHFVNNAAINSYETGTYETGNPPSLKESFPIEIKGFLRVGANLLIHTRKILASPLLMIIGALSVFLNRSLKLRKEIIISVILNILLVGSLSFSFAKYLLPMTVLLSLTAIPALLRGRFLLGLVLADALLVFIPIWNYFGKNFWTHPSIYLIPYWLALILIAYGFFKDYRPHPDAQRG